MNEFEYLLNVRIAEEREKVLLQLLGAFGDKIPQDIQDYINAEIKLERSMAKKMLSRCFTKISTKNQEQ